MWDRKPASEYERWHEDGNAGTFQDFLDWHNWVPGMNAAMVPTDETWDESYAREFLSDLKVGSTPATQLRIRNIPVNKL